jgi:hypothetical protein
MFCIVVTRTHASQQANIPFRGLGDPLDQYFVLHLHVVAQIEDGGHRYPAINTVQAFHGQGLMFRGQDMTERVDGRARSNGERNERTPVMTCEGERVWYPGGRHDENTVIERLGEVLRERNIVGDQVLDRVSMNIKHSQSENMYQSQEHFELIMIPGQ